MYKSYVRLSHPAFWLSPHGMAPAISVSLVFRLMTVELIPWFRRHKFSSPIEGVNAEATRKGYKYYNLRPLLKVRIH